MTQEQQPEALRVAAWLINAPHKTTHGDALIAGRELRRLHAREQELEAQLEAIGAGGVEPLRARQCLHQIQEPGGWTSLPGVMPKQGTPVLLDIGKKFPIRAMWAAAKSLEAAQDDDPVGDYDEATDTYYCPEGWYEWNEHEEVHWAVSATPRAWCPLPPSTSSATQKDQA